MPLEPEPPPCDGIEERPDGALCIERPDPGPAPHPPPLERSEGYARGAGADRSKRSVERDE